MAEKKRKSKVTQDPHKPASEYYKLKTKAVDDLVTANKENSPKVSAEELKKYKSGPGFTVPQFVKGLLIKLWFYGAVCFFIFWGLGVYIPGIYDMLFLLAVVMGMVNDLLVNNIFRYFEETPGANDRFMMFPKKGYATFIWNILYAFVILFFVYTLYNLINGTVVAISGEVDTVPLAVEPILFGTFCTFFDMLFIGMKRMFFRVIQDAKDSVKNPAGNKAKGKE